MSKKKKKIDGPDSTGIPVVEMDDGEDTSSSGFSLQQLADALGAEMLKKQDPTPAGPTPEAPAKEEASAPSPAAAPAAVPEASAGKMRELEESVKRLVAENRNQRNRIETEWRTKLKFANESFFREFIVIKDDIEKALCFAPADGDEKTAAFVAGIGHLDSAITTLLKRFEVEAFDAVGEPFDPALHEAMRMVDVAGAAANTVTAQYLKGYRYQDRLLRPAMVEVASGNAPADVGTPSEEPADDGTIEIETNDTEESHE